MAEKNIQAADTIKIRMYCLGTGDCFVLKFCKDDQVNFTMMIDCGSCRGGQAEFQPYLDHLVKYVEHSIDLLVITHEHNDHVNGFAKCTDIFKDIQIGEAWFAWTENPKDPNGAAGELQKKRSTMKRAFSNALAAFEKNDRTIRNSLTNEYYQKTTFGVNAGMLNGLKTLAEINLSDDPETDNSLPGMTAIKNLLKEKNVPAKYLNPGESVRINGAEGFIFHVLGPPLGREYIFKDGKEGVDVYNKRLMLNESSLAASAFLNMGNDATADLPFSRQFLVNEAKGKMNPAAEEVTERYRNHKKLWRRIDSDWLNSAGSLALRLNSHINNTSLALAIESEATGKVLLFPGDAEYGSWASWFEIDKWKPKKENEKHFVEQLLNRTCFYKVGHHLSFNGTALKKGIMMMESNHLAAMATLDLSRIAEKWKTTMPNKFLMQELSKKTHGKLFIMNEQGIDNPPSAALDPSTLGSEYETAFFEGTKDLVFIQFNCRV